VRTSLLSFLNSRSTWEPSTRSKQQQAGSVLWSGTRRSCGRHTARSSCARQASALGVLPCSKWRGDRVLSPTSRGEYRCHARLRIVPGGTGHRPIASTGRCPTGPFTRERARCRARRPRFSDGHADADERRILRATRRRRRRARSTLPLRRPAQGRSGLARAALRAPSGSRRTLRG
jgi:hypothetical protein